jgi:hypothetical protein
MAAFWAEISGAGGVPARSHQLGVGRKAVSIASVGVKWVKARKMGWIHEAAAQMNSAFPGQVGQESNLQPAVLEHSARCPDASKVVQIALESNGFRDAASSVVQKRLAGM